MATKFTFKVEHADEVPVTRRTTEKLPFPWDDLYMDFLAQQTKDEKKRKVTAFTVPVAFWREERNLEGDALKGASLKDRIRRAFYGWREAKEKDIPPVRNKKQFLGVTLAMEDVMTTDGTAQESTRVYLIPEAAEQRQAALDRPKRKAQRDDANATAITANGSDGATTSSPLA